MGFLYLCRLFEKLCIWLHNKSELSLMLPSGLPGETVESLLGYDCSKIGGLGKVHSEGSARLLNCFCPLRQVTRTLNAWKIDSWVSLPKNPPYLFVAHKTCELREKSFSHVFWENLSRKQGFWDEFLFPGSYFCTKFPSCQPLEPCCSKTAFADFWDDNFFLLISVYI